MLEVLGYTPFVFIALLFAGAFYADYVTDSVRARMGWTLTGLEDDAQ